MAFYCPLQLTVLPDGPTVAGRSFDISLGGVGITADVFLERGQTVQASFHFSDGPQGEAEESVLGRVAYSRADEDGNRIGIEFLEILRESAQPLLAQKLNNL